MSLYEEDDCAVDDVAEDVVVGDVDGDDGDRLFHLEYKKKHKHVHILVLVPLKSRQSLMSPSQL